MDSLHVRASGRGPGGSRIPPSSHFFPCIHSYFSFPSSFSFSYPPIPLLIHLPPRQMGRWRVPVSGPINPPSAGGVWGGGVIFGSPFCCPIHHPRHRTRGVRGVLPLAVGLVNKWQYGKAAQNCLTPGCEFLRTVRFMVSVSYPWGPRTPPPRFCPPIHDIAVGPARRRSRQAAPDPGARGRING